MSRWPPKHQSPLRQALPWTPSASIMLPDRRCTGIPSNSPAQSPKSASSFLRRLLIGMFRARLPGAPPLTGQIREQFQGVSSGSLSLLQGRYRFLKSGRHGRHKRSLRRTPGPAMLIAATGTCSSSSDRHGDTEPSQLNLFAIQRIALLADSLQVRFGSGQ